MRDNAVRLLPPYLLVPAHRAANAIEKRQSGVDQLRCDPHFMVRQVRYDRQPVLRHVSSLLAGIHQPAAEQLVELHRMLKPDHVAVAVDEHHSKSCMNYVRFSTRIPSTMARMMMRPAATG
jgi:hypothetical protein